MKTAHTHHQHNKSRKVKITLLIVFVLWFLLSLILGYQYLLFSADKGAGKGGTFVEAIFDNVSYLPYWGVSTNDTYYQSLFFASCLDYDGEGYVDDLCSIDTDDNMTYTIKVLPGKVRSDGEEIDSDDVFFTYNDIIRNNFWKISYLDAYSAIKVQKKEDGTITVQFPFASVDNLNFFTQFVLPQHTVSGMSLESYKTDFARNPVYGGCARILEQSKDSASFVLQMDQCDFTNILYYQLKYFDSLTDFENYAKEGGDQVITLYPMAKKLAGFDEYRVLTDKYMTIFFNNESKQLNKDIRRALGGLINSTIYSGDFSHYFYKDQLLFETFWSDGSNLEHHIINKNPNLDINKDGLESINITKLPPKVQLTGTKQKQVYYLDALADSGKYAVYFKTDVQYDSLIISQENVTGTVRLQYNPQTTRYQFNLEGDVNFFEGLNKYSIKGYTKDKIETLVDLDIYYLNLPPVDEDTRQDFIEQKGKIKIIYFMDATTNYVASTLKKIFADRNLDQYFNFVGYDKSSDFDAKLLSKDYDIVISPFDFARKKDFSSFLLTDVPTINPSLYTNPSMASYISDYVHKSDDIKESLRTQINDIYANDMPFVVLGQVFTPYYLNADHSLLSQDEVYTLEEFKNILLSSIELSSNLRLDKKKVLSGTVFLDFIESSF